MIKANEEDWKTWCRTCGKNNISEFEDDFVKWESIDDILLENIRKLTNLETLLKQDGIVCIDCHTVLKEMQKFSYSCIKINEMFTEIHLDYESFGESDLLNVRSRYGLKDIVMQNLNSKSKNDYETVERRKMEKDELSKDLIICYADCKDEILEQHDNVDNKNHKKIKDNYYFDCSKCPKRFTTLRGLRIHQIIHLSGYKKPDRDPIVCEQCGKCCLSKGALSEHQATHSADYAHVCSKCSKKFKHSYHLQVHMKIHKEIAFICDACGQRCKTKRTITQHMLVHSAYKKFKCKYCGNEYKRARTLKTHLILHTGQKPYKCPFCDKSFTYGPSCRFHKKKVHPKELAEMEAAGKVHITNLPKIDHLQPK